MSCSPKEAANTSVRLSCSTLIDILFQSRIHWTFSSSVLGTLLTSTPAAPVPKVSTTKAFQMRASPSGTFFHLSFCIHHILPCTIVLGELIFSFSLDYKLAEGRSHVCCLGEPPSQCVLTATPGGKAAWWMTVSEWQRSLNSQWAHQTIKSSRRHFSHEVWVGFYFIQNSNPYPQDFFLSTPIFIPCT